MRFLIGKVIDSGTYVAVKAAALFRWVSFFVEKEKNKEILEPASML
jgi:hypothetical protein